MAEHVLDRHELMSEKQFLEELQQGIQIANREIIQARIPELSKDSIHALAVTVSRLRASYLEAAFQMAAAMSDGTPDRSIVEDIRIRREMFEEARNAYDALVHAVQRRYIDVSGRSDDHGEAASGAVCPSALRSGC